MDASVSISFKHDHMVQPLAIRAAVCNYAQQTCLYACLPRQKCASAAPSHFNKGQSVHLIRWAHTARHPCVKILVGIWARNKLGATAPCQSYEPLLILLKRTSFRIDVYNWGNMENMLLLDEMMLTQLPQQAHKFQPFLDCLKYPLMSYQLMYQIEH